MIEGVVHLLPQDRSLVLDRALYPHHDVEGKTMDHLDHENVGTPQVDLHHQHHETLVEAEGEGVQVLVIIALDPLHLQKPLAHVRLEETGRDALLPSHLTALHHPQDQGVTDVGIRPHLSQGHVLVRWADIEGVRADQKDHPLTLIMMKRLTYALIITRAEDIVMTAAAVAVAVAAEIEATDALAPVRAGAAAPIGAGKGRDIAQ